MEVHKIDYGQRVYQGTLDAVRQVIIATMLVIDSYNGETIGEPWISDRDEYVTGATPSTGAQVAYTLDEPLEIPVSVSNTPIKSLSGYNHIESSTGDMEVEYITEGYQPLVDLIQESQHVYSTQEQIVGKWVDGSDLYERTFELSNPSQSGDISTGQTYDIVFVVSGYYMLNDGNSILSANQFLNVSNYTYVHVEKDGDIKYNITGYTATKLSVTIRYTKTPSNNRSLSKGSTEGLKADLSEVKGESDGILKEDKKALKIDESEDTETKEEADETEENADEMQDETIAK